jgi:competence protein ComGC
MYRRNCRVKVIIGVVVASLLLLIIIPIATKTAH